MIYIKKQDDWSTFLQIGKIYMHNLQTQKSETRRLHILNSSFELVLRKGFAGVGLQEILKHCEVPKGSFYHYFQSKEAFGCDLLRNYIQDYQHRLTLIWNNDETAKIKILRYFELWIEAPDWENGWADSCLIVKLAAEVADLSEEMRFIMDQGVTQLIARLTQLIEQGQTEQSIPTQMSASLTAQTLYQMWLGAALLSKLQKDKSPLHQALHATQHLLTPLHSGI